MHLSTQQLCLSTRIMLTVLDNPRFYFVKNKECYISELIVPAARRLGKPQVLLEHERTWTFFFPAASLLIKNFMMSSAVTAETFFLNS